MNYKEEYKKFIENYIEKYSPLRIHDKVLVKIWNSSARPYEIERISIDDSGEFYYNVISPRSRAEIPNKFRINDLEKYTLE